MLEKDVPEEAVKALVKAKIALMNRKDSMFYTTVCFSLGHRWDDTIPTAATDGLNIYFNPDFFIGLNSEQRLFLLLHETKHVVLNHFTRMGDRDPEIWNEAGDFVINAMLIKMGYVMIPGALYDKQYQDMTTEEVYDILIKDHESRPPNFTPDMLKSDKKPEDLKRDLDEIMVRASVQAEMAGSDIGNLPGEAKQYLDSLKDPKLPWNVVLRKFMNDLAKTDYSFKKPNRRFFPDHLLPSAYGYGLEHIAVAIDVSASITQEQFHTFASEVKAIMDQLKPKKLTVIQFDTQVQQINVLKQTKDIFDVEFFSGGGTAIGPVIEWMNENKPKGMLIFTDGYFHMHFPEPKGKLVWLVHSNEDFKDQMQYGQVIDYPLVDES